MASSKMIRFLNSIGIEDVGPYDLSFEMVGKDPFNPKRVIFTIRKETAWDLGMLLLFREGMQSLKYLYDLRFTYSENISSAHAKELFEDFFYETHRSFPSFDVISEGEELFAVFPNRSPDGYEEKAINEFNELLKFASYPYELKPKLGPLKEAKIEEKVSLPPELEEPEEEAIPEPEQTSEEEYVPADESIPEPDPEPVAEEIDEDEKAFRESLRAKERESERELAMQRLQRINDQQRRKGNYLICSSIKEALAQKAGNVEVCGELFGIGKDEGKPNRAGKLTQRFGLGDWSEGVYCRIVEGNGIGPEEFDILRTGDGRYVRIQGAITYDTYSASNEKQIRVHSIELAERPHREDNAPRKRVELHTHTKMSQMDGLADPGAYVDMADKWGMSAIAITDHGVVQGFPEAEKAKKELKNKNFKVLYGVEFYMFDWPDVVFGNLSKKPLQGAKYCVFDFETTGLSQTYDKPVEFGAVIIENGMVTGKTIDIFIDPKREIREESQRINNITKEDLRNALSNDEAMKLINDFIGDAILVSHNAHFDLGFLNAMRKEAGQEKISNPIIDTLALADYLYPEALRVNEGSLAKRFNVETPEGKSLHRANVDAEVLAKLWLRMLADAEKLLGKQNLTHEDLSKMPISSNQLFYRHMRAYHTIAIAKNKKGLKDLYRLISLSETTYLSPQTGQRPPTPKIPRDVLNQYRENLIIGSACFNSRLFELAMNGTQEDMEKEMDFYDYVEIQPKGNYSYLLNVGNIEKEELDDILLRIIDAADKKGKKVVATGDCHYIDPEEKILRDIYINAEGLGKTKHPLNLEYKGNFENPDQYLRTTEEMLNCFRDWLSEEKCQEIVIDNSNWVADQCLDDCTIVYDILHAPDANLPGTKEKLRALCEENLRKTYGESPDPRLIERLNKELDGIISNGYSVTYWIAHLLVKKASEDGYFIGSRGSVGSSFAAHMAGITEVNPLEPHYICRHCHHFEWAKDDPELATYRSGFDLPKKLCPECGHEMWRDGQSIPFEVFLGFHAEKVPDIDLNFPRDYQERGHAFTRTLLSTPEENEKIARGEFIENPHVIRAGTISGAEMQNAMGYVKRYYEHKKGRQVLPEERAFTNYLGFKCCGVKRTTGQHPGGIVVIPADMDCYDFTPYQHPADDYTASWLTSHFEWGSMHDGVLKLDELGHVDPVTLRMQCLLTGLDLQHIGDLIPMDDPQVLSLFSSPKALKLKENPLGLITGATGLPEFGTNFVQGILLDAQPKNFNDLLIISGISHGTNVWKGNAQDLIKDGRTLSDVIGCRDDIMDYLIKMGMDSSLAFKIMEAVRKNNFKYKKEEYSEAMRKCHVPEWYIESCQKIRYLFPRAHATAYVMGAIRAGWFKMYRPLEFYATYLTARCDHFDLFAMHEGLDAIVKAYNDLKNKEKEDGTDVEYLRSLTIAAELCDRGFKIDNVSLMKSEVSDWVIDKENNSLIPPFVAIPSFNSLTAEGIVEARKKGAFLSKEDLADRVKRTINVKLSEQEGKDMYYPFGGKTIETLDEYKVLEGLSESNQMSLFDFFS